MKTSRTTRLVAATAASAAFLLPAHAASAQDCVVEGPGSAVGQPEQCEVDDDDETDVLGEVVEREEQPAPDPETAPVLAATGSGSMELAIVAAAALGAGGALVGASRRRRNQD